MKVEVERSVQVVLRLDGEEAEFLRDFLQNGPEREEPREMRLRGRIFEGLRAAVPSPSLAPLPPHLR